MRQAAPSARQMPPWMHVAIAAWWMACGSIYLTLPPSPDQFEHGYMGWQLLEGAVPYRDFIDMNWPGVMWMHALSTALFGNTLWSWRALDFTFVALSAFFLGDLLRRSAGDTAATVGTLMYPLFYASLHQWFSGQHDMSASQFLLAAMWFHVRAYETRSWRWQLGTGMLLAAAMLNKPTVGALGPLLMLHGFLIRLPIRLVAAHTGVAAIAAVGSLATALLALLALGSRPGEVFDAIYTYNAETQFLERATLGQLAERWVEVHVGSWHYLSILAAAGGFWLLRRGGARRPAALALPILWLSGLLSFVAQHRGFPYHLAPCFIPVVGLAAAAVGFSLDAARAKGAPPWVFALAPLLVLLVAGGGAKKLHTNYPGLLPALREGNYAIHLAQYHGGDELTFAETFAFAERIMREIPPGETILVAGTARSMNFLSRRAQSTRFFYIPVLHYAQPPMPFAGQWTDLFAGDLRRSMPRLCLVGPWVRKHWLEGNSASALTLRDLLASRYRKTGVYGAMGTVDIYERM